MKKHGVAFVQPILTKYREPLFRCLDILCGSNFTVFADPASSDFGEARNTGYLVRCVGYSPFLKLFKKPTSDFYKEILNNRVVVHFADFKYLSLWYLLFVCFFSGRKLYLHGQGGYKRNGFFHGLIYNLVLLFVDGYICYTEFSRTNLKQIVYGFLHRKIFVVDNSLYLKPYKNDLSGKDVLYIGRLRAGCGIEILLEASKVACLDVNIVGGGDAAFVDMLKRKYSNFRYYGVLFDEEQQLSIARGCFAGAYGGDAGLSVVHYMSYGLPVVVHDDIYRHMGPEPSYIVDEQNGLTFQRGNVQSLAAALKRLKEDSELRAKLSQGAAQTFEQLNNPPMHEKFAKILGLL